MCESAPYRRADTGLGQFSAVECGKVRCAGLSPLVGRVCSSTAQQYRFTASSQNQEVEIRAAKGLKPVNYGFDSVNVNRLKWGKLLRVKNFDRGDNPIARMSDCTESTGTVATDRGEQA